MNVEDWLGKDNALGIEIWNKKYRNGDESFDAWLDRVSGGKDEVKQLILQKKFLFGGRILANRGVKDRKYTLSNCYVLSPPEDSIESIFETAGKLARTFSYGGGVGIDLSKLAPRGAKVNNSAGESTGAVSFTDLYSMVTGLIGQQGRRGALMLSLSCDHPDLEEFINLKTDLNRVTKANVSVRASNHFMHCVKYDLDYELYFKRDETDDEIVATVPARKIFQALCDANYDYGEPGILFWDTIENDCLLSKYNDFTLSGVNPCLTGDTLIQTTEGEIPIQDLVGKNNVYVYCMDDKGSLAIRKALRIWKTRENASLVEVRTHRGNLRCTPEHLIHTRNRGWVPACELKHGDKITGLNRRMKDETHVAVALSGDSKYIAEHRFVMGAFENIIGKDVHHIDDNPFNNKRSNLMVLEHSAHSKVTNTGRKIESIRDSKGRYVTKPVKKQRTSVNQGIRTGVNWTVKDVVALVNTEDVYDITVDEYHNFVANGMIVHNCAEQPLPAGGSCLLGSMNLAEYVYAPGKFDIRGFETDVQIAVKALNEVLEEGLPLHPLQEQRDAVKKWKQIGLGIMGLGDMLVKMGIKYGSTESFELCDDIGKKMFRSALIASANLKKGHDDWDDALIRSDMYKYHFMDTELFYPNNSQLLTIAPTGSISTMIGVSGGIEPIFAKSFTRRTVSLSGKDEYHEVYPTVIKNLMDDLNVDIDHLPDYVVTSSDIPWFSRVVMQATWQKHVDASISSTINLPEYFPKDEIMDIYLTAWELGCKGLTIFRQGCKRDAILTTEVKSKDVEPSTLVGKKRKLMTGCGSLHCTAFFDSQTGELKETYLSKGSTGGCNNFMIGLSRLISLSARSGCSIDEIVDQLKSTGACPSYAVRKATKGDTSLGSCCPMAVGWALSDMYDEMQSEIKGTPKPTAVTIKNPCPKCGAELEFSGGCNVCKSCGWTKCD